MNDNDIIKALEHCEGVDGISYCNDCPLFDDDNCVHIIAMESRKLINRLEKTNRKNERIIELADKTIETQKAEIERLQHRINELQHEISSCNSEIERLQGKNKCIKYSHKKSRAETLKEFIKRFKKIAICERYFLINLHQGSVDIGKKYTISEKHIDNLVKEMTENDFKE